MKFRVLGPLQVMRGPRDVAPAAAKLRQALCLLALYRGQVVHTDLLIDELWGADPPRSALATLQTYAYKLRGALDEGGRAESRSVLRTRPNGYLLAAGPGDVDAAQFERLLTEGITALGAGNPARAATVLTEATTLWHGPVFAGVTAGSALTPHAARLEEKRFLARELRVEAHLQLGRHHEVLDELRELIAAKPDHEGFVEMLMTALDRCGHRVEALEVYGRTYERLVSEFGLEPAGRLRRLQQAILACPPSQERPRDEHPILPARPAAAVTVKPAQIPSDNLNFVGRDEALDTLGKFLAHGAATGAAAGVLALTGPPGAGKTAVAVRAGHQARGLFGDGQLFADLRGSTLRPSAPADVLHAFLRSVGLPPAQIPHDLGEAAQVFSDWTSGKNMLVVLDDAYSAAQLRPLLPGGGHCAVIITSRSPVPHLDGVTVIALDKLSLDEGVAILGNLAGHDRVGRERDAAREIVRWCGRLPLAVCVAGIRLAATPGWRLSRLAAQLRDPGRRLGELRCNGLDVESRFEAGFARLGEPEKSAFRLLSLLREETFPTARVAAMLGCGPTIAKEFLEALVDSHLLRVHQDKGGGLTCYGFDELTQAYAHTRLEEFLARPLGANSSSRQRSGFRVRPLGSWLSGVGGEKLLVGA
jgi:DNA-binding SARP family transcriptional activator